MSPLPVIVAEIAKSGGVIRVTIDTFRGQTIVDVRQFYDDGNKMSPTRKGLSCSVRHLPAIAAAMNAALARAREMGLVHE